ncbi:outer membrane beta-barrel protein [Chitinophaga sp. CC14]|uniref:outer membrane beta-barrel protein n=1 Tax=Chitinophaga sp. CC14 TaxID=3029199 RepID=UPI003B7F06B8
MKPFVLFFFIHFLSMQMTGQIASKLRLKGHVLDKESRTVLCGATITCLYSRDSSVVSYRLTNENGMFFFDSLKFDKYVLHITFLGYQQLMIPVSPKVGEVDIDLGTIGIKRIGLTLNQIEIVELKKVVRVTKDTIEFNASHFKTKSNASAEDLFKMIPGVQVDKDGTIRVNGNIVKNIMVDGRPLFGDDPKILSGNLQADLIDKVQFIDMEGDQRGIGRLSGNGSGKGINITIKKEKRGLVSGELTAAYGSNNRFATKLNLSHFRNQQQMLLFGNGDNVNGSLDSKSIGSGGVQRNWIGGGSYSDIISKKLTINASYLITDNLSSSQRTSVMQSFVADSILYYNQASDNRLSLRNSALSLQIEYKIDSLQKLTFGSQLSLSTNSNVLTSSYESLTSQLWKLNSSTLDNTNMNRVFSLSGSVQYEKKFMKKGRAMDMMFSYSTGHNDNSGYNKSDNFYYPMVGDPICDTINYHVLGHGRIQQLFFMISYTEPILKNGSVNIIVASDHLSSMNDKSVLSYNGINSLYDRLVDSLSYKFDNDPIQHIAKIRWLFQKEKYDWSVSLAALNYQMSAQYGSSEKDLSRRILRFLPDAHFNFLRSGNKRFRFSYRNVVEFPEASQLVSILDISDPLYQKKGNPRLDPMSAHNLSIAYSGINGRSLRSFSLELNGKFMFDQIVNATLIDSVGRQMIQPLNLSGGRFFSLDIENGFPLINPQSSLFFIAKAMIRKDLSYANQIPWITKSVYLTQSIRFNYSHKSLYDFILSGNLNYNKVRYPDTNLRKSVFWNGGFAAAANINLPFGFIVGTDVYIGLSSGRAEGYNTGYLMMNASIAKQLFQHKEGLIELQGFDLLGQNVSVTRNIGGNYIEDLKTNTLQRFLILKFSYFLGKKHK